MKKWILLILGVLITISSYSIDGYKFRILLKDKGNTAFSIHKPQEFLSARAIERRQRQKIAIDNLDLPVSPDYIKAVEDLGCKVVAKSKWNNTVTIHCDDSTIVSAIKKLDFVMGADFVWMNYFEGPSLRIQVGKAMPRTGLSSEYYGAGFNQIDMVNGNFLHEQGYKGEGIEIAVIDAGFVGLDENHILDNILVLGRKDFVYEEGGETSHGFNVLSLMAANKPGQYVGTAPDAKYWLLRSEDNRWETPVEEDYWVAAAEYADSLGVDIITSSLGYSFFLGPFDGYSHSWTDLDGQTTLISQAAEVAVSKGVFVVNAVGNNGDKDFLKISVPSDAEHVLAVGSVNLDASISKFSSIGFTADGRIKPDVVALGGDVNFINTAGDIFTSSGTSYATPIVTGMVACLWQAYPKLTNYELLDIIRKSGSKYVSPDNYYGYGIPDMKQAYAIAGGASGIEEDLSEELPPFQLQMISKGHLRIKNNKDNFSCRLIVSTLDGKVVLSDMLTKSEQDFFVFGLNNIYIINISGRDINRSWKVKF